MNKLTELREQVAAYLAFCDGFEGAEVLAAYPPRERFYPLRRRTVAVGIDGVELIPAGFGGYLGESGAEAVLGGRAGITLRFDLFAPAKEEAGELHELYEALCESLVVERSPFGVTKLTCGEIQYDPDAAANRVTARGSLTAALLRGKEEERFASAIVISASQTAEEKNEKE